MLLRKLFFQSGLRMFHYSASSAKLVPFKLADIGEGITEVEVKEWYVKEGDKVSQFDNICEVQSDKAAVTITSRFNGIIKNVLHDVGSIVKVGSALVNIDTHDIGEDAPAEKTLIQTESAPSVGAPILSSLGTTHGKAIATPAVRRIAMENNLKLSEITGTGKDNRVLKEDVLRFLNQISSPTDSTPETSALTNISRVSIVNGKDKIVPVRGYMRAMVKSMSDASKITHFGYNDEVYFDQLVKLRGQLKQLGKEKGVKLSYMPFIIKATSLALSKYPILNSSVDGNFDNVIYKAAHNICLAIDTPGGLVVPNIKHCEQKTIWEIAADLNNLQEAGAKQAIKSEDLTEGTFTLSNIGAIGGTYATPIIFPPQVAIGAIGKIQKLPRYDQQDNIYPAHVVKFSWAADHRIIDGATIARFSNLLKDYLENPALMGTELR